jgi:hypothetical protein
MRPNVAISSIMGEFYHGRAAFGAPRTKDDSMANHNLPLLRLTYQAAMIQREAENLAILCYESIFWDIWQVPQCRGFSSGHFLLETAKIWSFRHWGVRRDEHKMAERPFYGWIPKVVDSQNLQRMRKYSESLT